MKITFIFRASVILLSGFKSLVRKLVYPFKLCQISTGAGYIRMYVYLLRAM